MRKILNLVIQERHNFREANESVVSFEIRDDVQEPEKALRAAVNEFLLSGCEKATWALESSNYCFNWGDCMSFVPDEIYIKHGLTPMKNNSIDVFVDHDEILCENYEDIKDAKIKRLIRDCMGKGNTDRDKKLAELMEKDSFTVYEMQELSYNETDEVLTVLFDEMLEILLKK